MRIQGVKDSRIPAKGGFTLRSNKGSHQRWIYATLQQGFEWSATEKVDINAWGLDNLSRLPVIQFTVEKDKKHKRILRSSMLQSLLSSL